MPPALSTQEAAAFCWRVGIWVVIRIQAECWKGQQPGQTLEPDYLGSNPSFTPYQPHDLGWFMEPHCILVSSSGNWGQNYLAPSGDLGIKWDNGIYNALKTEKHPRSGWGEQESQVIQRMMSQKDSAEPTCFLGCLHHLMYKDGCWLSSWLKSSWLTGAWPAGSWTPSWLDE